MLCVIWYHLYNFENVKNIHGRVWLLVKLQANFTKSNEQFLGNNVRFWIIIRWRFVFSSFSNNNFITNLYVTSFSIISFVSIILCFTFFKGILVTYFFIVNIFVVIYKIRNSSFKLSIWKYYFWGWFSWPIKKVFRFWINLKTSPNTLIYFKTSLRVSNK